MGCLLSGFLLAGIRGGWLLTLLAWSLALTLGALRHSAEN
jgi:hypothetical protein